MKNKIWTRDFLLVSLANFLIYMIFYLLMVIVAPYAVDRLGTSPGVAGLLSGMFLFGILVGRLGAGPLAERVQGKKILLVGAALHGLAALAYFLARSVPLFLAIRFFHGIAFGIAHTGAGTIAGQVLPPQRRGEGIGLYTLGQITATALGPFLGITLLHHGSFGAIFLMASAMAVAAFGISLAVVSPSSSPPRRQKGLQLSDFIEYRAIPISVIVLLAGFVYFSLMTFMPLYGREYRLQGPASLFFLVYAATVILSRPLSGRLLDKMGEKVVVYPCLTFYALGMLLLAIGNSGPVLLLSAFVIGLGYGNFFSCGHAIAIKRVPLERIALATATYYIFIDIGSGIGPFLSGSLLPFFGYRGLFGSLTLLVVLSLILYGLFRRWARD